MTSRYLRRRVCLNSMISGLFVNNISCHLVIFSIILNNSSIIDRDKDLYYIYLLLLTNKEKAHDISAFKDGLVEIKLG